MRRTVAELIERYRKEVLLKWGSERGGADPPAHPIEVTGRLILEEPEAKSVP
jgi:hypothetical protein